jgi:hypothetical protein
MVLSLTSPPFSHLSLRRLLVAVGRWLVLEEGIEDDLVGERLTLLRLRRRDRCRRSWILEVRLIGGIWRCCLSIVWTIELVVGMEGRCILKTIPN